MTGTLLGEVAATTTPTSAADRRAQVATAVQRVISSEAGSVRRLLVDTRPDAPGAARAAEAAALQDACWSMNDQLFADRDHLSTADLVSHAEHLGLDADRFLADLDSHQVRRRVERHLTSAEASGAVGTPPFFVNARRHCGPFDAGALIAALEATGPGEPVAPTGHQTTHDARPATTQEKP